MQNVAERERELQAMIECDGAIADAIAILEDAQAYDWACGGIAGSYPFRQEHPPIQHTDTHRVNSPMANICAGIAFGFALATMLAIAVARFA